MIAKPIIPELTTPITRPIDSAIIKDARRTTKKAKKQTIIAFFVVNFKLFAIKKISRF